MRNGAPLTNHKRSKGPARERRGAGVGGQGPGANPDNHLAAVAEARAFSTLLRLRLSPLLLWLGTLLRLRLSPLLLWLGTLLRLRLSPLLLWLGTLLRLSALLLLWLSTLLRLRLSPLLLLWPWLGSRASRNYRSDRSARRDGLRRCKFAWTPVIDGGELLAVLCCRLLMLQLR